jgi:two-component system CheB/CheR fusion protein
MYRLLGLPQEGTVPGAQAFMSLVHPEDLPVLTAKVKKALESHGDFAHDFRILRADTGEERWLAGRGRVLANAAGELLAMVGVNYDITEATRNQAKLKVASERRAEFLAVLGHELRNPLAPLSYLARQMEMAAGQDKTQAKNAQVIKRQVDLLTRLVDDLLEVARIELGKIDLHWETVPADELIAGAVEVVMPAITDRQLQLNLDLAPGILIRGDRMRLMQVITNLLKNAAKYTPLGGRIQVQVKQTDQSVQIRISDTGPGIDPSLLPTLFDPFTQGLKTLDRTDGGLGVGLSVVKRLVELHGGQVSVASSPKGTTFTISLSAESLNPAITLNGDPAGPVNETVTESLRGLHLLLAEDQRDAADILAQLLRAEGLQVDVCAAP